jgi:acetyl-CoA acetyltransferase
MKPGSVAVVGAAESTRLGKIPDMSVIGLHADAALNALADAGLKPSDIDGVATAGESPVAIAHYLGIVPTWVDGTQVGGCSFMLHVRHAAAAINEGLCKTVLITHGESGRSRVGAGGGFGGGRAGGSLAGQFEAPYGPAGPPTMFTIPVLRYLKTYGLTEEDLAWVAVIQREWAAKNPRASMKDPITVDDVLDSPMIAYPFRMLMCCLVTDGGGAIVMTTSERARDLPAVPVDLLGFGEACTHYRIMSMPDLGTIPAAISAPAALRRAGLSLSDIDVFELYDSFTITVILTLEAIGCCARGEGGAFVEDQRLGPGGALPTNTSGGGLSYCHPGMFGIFTVIEAVRQLRGNCGDRQVPGARTALAHGTGGTLSSGATVILGAQ